MRSKFLSPLFATKRVDLFLKRLKKLQTVLGDLNDAVMVRAILSDKRMSGADDPAWRNARDG